MVQCEMCGAETSDPKTVKVEGAELDVCSECADFGTEVKTQDTSSTSTKYSTGSSATSGNSSSSGSGRSSGSSSSGGSRRRQDMFDDMGELAQDYDEIVRQAREKKGLSQADLASELNEKASLIRKIERADTLPSDDVQTKLERNLDIDLDAGGSSAEDKEWSSDSSTTTTLGDVVKRKD